MLTLRITMLSVALACAAPAAAQLNRNVSLNWVRAPEADGCTSGKSVAQRVQGYFESEQLLSEERFQFVSSSSAHIAIEALVTPYQDGWQVAIGVSRGDARVEGSEFVQRSRSCEQLEVQAALVISQLLDSPAFAQEPAQLDTQTAPVLMAAYVSDTAPVSSAITPSPMLAAEPVHRRSAGVDSTEAGRLRVRLLTGGSIERGFFPGSGIGARMGIALEPEGLFPIELHTSFSASAADGQFPDDRSGIAPAASASFLAARLLLLGCPATWKIDRWGIAGCAGLEGSAVNTQLVGFREEDSAWVSWFGLELAVRPSFDITDELGLWLEAGASFTVVASDDFVARTTESSTDGLSLYSAPRQTAQLVLGIFYVL